MPHGSKVAVGVLVASACAGKPAAVPQVPIAWSSPSGLRFVWYEHELHPIGQPIAVGDVAVGIVSSDRHAFVVGIDPATGHSLWRQQVSASRISAGEKIVVIPLGDDKVAYLRPPYPDVEDAQLVVADVHTGKDLAASPPALFTSPPIVCANGKDVCAIICTGQRPPKDGARGAPSLSSAGSQLLFRLDLATGEALAQNALREWTSFLDPTGLALLGDSPGTSLGLLRGGAPQWLIPGRTAFPADFTIRAWEWQLFSDPHVFVGSMYGRYTEFDGKRALDLATGTAMAGLSERTGKVLWRDVGSGFHCNLDHGVPVRCRASGLLVYVDGLATVRDFQATLEGFDITTGRTTWSAPMGAAKSLQPFERPAIAGPHEVVIDGPAGPVVLDYTTGHIEPPVPGATFWCRTVVRFELSPPVEASRASWFGARHGWTYERFGGDHAFVCDASGKPAGTLPSIAATLAAGARIGDHAVIATADGYLGFRVPPR